MPAGRPTKLTEELILQIAEYIQKGNFRTIAAKACGVPLRTFAHWIKNGRKFPGGIYGQLLHFCQLAEGAAETLAVQRIANSPDTDDLKWWLSRKHPRRWAADRTDWTAVLERLAALEERYGDADPDEGDPPSD